ncbi:MAG: hypothetical protein C0424_11100 [Sphingobacteriaceae bacterium]|nr:hypothetical protein [Sphingobacteriaceae bacterium]
MTTAAIQKEVEQLLPKLKSGEQQLVLAFIKDILTADNVIGNPASISEYNRDIDAAVARMDAGNKLSQEEVEAYFRKW